MDFNKLISILGLTLIKYQKARANIKYLKYTILIFKDSIGSLDKKKLDLKLNKKLKKI